MHVDEKAEDSQKCIRALTKPLSLPTPNLKGRKFSKVLSIVTL
jgi:hypothetical protein